MNKVGHGISYSQLEEIETGIAKVQMKAVENGTLLPSNCQLNFFMTFIFDNNDLAEETLSGKNTTHCTNGIVIQCKADSCQASQIIDDNNIKPKQCSFKAPPVLLVPYSGGKNVSPKAVALDTEQLVLSKEELIVGEMKDVLWLISRAAAEDTLFSLLKEKQQIPSWTAFFVKINEAETPRESVICFSQLLDHSPTELSTTYTSLKRSIATADQIGLTDVVVACGLAIYAKAVEIMNKKRMNWDELC